MAVTLQPKKVNAITGVEEAVLVTLAGVLYSMGVSLGVDTAKDLYNWLAENSPKAWEALKERTSEKLQTVPFLVAGVQYGYGKYCQWNYDQWYTLTEAIRQYFSQDKFTDLSAQFSTTNPDGYIGFTSSTKFSFTVPNADTSTSIFSLPHGKMYVYKNVKMGDVPFLDKAYDGLAPSYTYDANHTNQDFVVFSSDDGWYLYSCDSLYYGRTYYSCCDNNSYSSYLFVIDNSSSYLYFSSLNLYDNTTDTVYRKCCNWSQGGYYYAPSNNQSAQAAYKGKIFDNERDLMYWLMSELGFTTPKYNDKAGGYNPSDTSKDVSIDRDRLNQVADEAVKTKDAAGTKDMVIPTTEESVKVAEANPDAVLEAAESVPYSGELPKIDDTPLWQTKFPFCIPWDFYNLISGFYSPSDTAPKFDFIILPANSFGLDNDDVHFAIDFEKYDFVVKVIRFFISVFFILGLIFATRKLIWTGG